MKKHSRRLSWNEQATLNTSPPSSAARNFGNEKLQASISKKIAKNQLLVVSNRVNQLEKIKYNTEKEIAQLQEDIFKKELSLKHKFEEAEQRRRHHEYKQKIFDNKKQSIKRFREETKQNIRNFTELLLKNKQKLVKDKKEIALKWQEEISQEKDKDSEDKEAKYKSGKDGYVRALRTRCLTQRAHKERLKDSYNEIIKTDRKMEAETYDRISELEIAEGNLVDELSRTMELKNSLKANLKRLRTSIS